MYLSIAKTSSVMSGFGLGFRGSVPATGRSFSLHSRVRTRSPARWDYRLFHSTDIGGSYRKNKLVGGGWSFTSVWCGEQRYFHLYLCPSIHFHYVILGCPHEQLYFYVCPFPRALLMMRIQTSTVVHTVKNSRQQKSLRKFEKKKNGKNNLKSRIKISLR